MPQPAHTILVTGTSSGFGLLTSLELARRGHSVIATMRDVSRAGALKAAADTEGLALHILAMDVADKASVESGFAQAEAIAGPITAIVNNAGVQSRGALEDYDDDEALALLDTNVIGPMRLIRAALPGFRARKAGVIVNLSSLAGIASLPSEGLYAGSKHALEGMTEALFYEVSPWNIRIVNIQAGGFPSTGLSRGGWTRRSGANSPYHADMDAFSKSVDDFQAAAPEADPQDIAVAIAAAIENPETPFRVIVGADADFVIGAHRRMEFEEFAALFRNTLQWQLAA